MAKAKEDEITSNAMGVCIALGVSFGTVIGVTIGTRLGARKRLSRKTTRASSGFLDFVLRDI